MNFEEMDTEPSTGKMMDFHYCEEYLRSISYRRKANTHAVVISRLIKKINNDVNK